jgi:acyl-CoA thioesterase FadM
MEHPAIMSWVFRHSTVITPDDTTVLHFGGDPTAPGFGQHLTFDQILKRCGAAWQAFLDELGAFGTGIIVPRLEVSYAAEVVDGDLAIEVDVLSIGRTSFRIRLGVQQAGVTAATVEVVIVSFGYDDRGPLPLTDEQRGLLTPHLLPG